MGEPLIERALKRDRWIVLAALAVATALSWLYIVWLARHDMGGAMMEDMPDMPGMVMPEAASPFEPTQFALLFAMWAVMMIGMMTPSAAAMILTYARVGRAAAADGKVFAPTFWFALGYALAWIGFSLTAAVTQSLLREAALVTAMMTFAAPRIGGAVLIAAGLYQWTPLKEACLSQCRAPLHFVQAHGGFKPEAAASVRLGLLHGLYCIGCCWALMALLFVAGVMNLIWIAALAILVLAEKALPGGRWVARAAGVAFAVAGAWLIAGA